MPCGFSLSSGCDNTQVSDLSPLDGMRLELIIFSPKNTTKGIDAIRRMKSLKSIAEVWGQPGFSPEVFWKKYDAGEFNK